MCFVSMFCNSDVGIVGLSEHDLPILWLNFNYALYVLRLDRSICFVFKLLLFSFVPLIAFDN